MGAKLNLRDNSQDVKCWSISSEKYCITLFVNVLEASEKKGLRLAFKCMMPMKAGCKPELDCTDELKADGIQW